MHPTIICFTLLYLLVQSSKTQNDLSVLAKSILRSRKGDYVDVKIDAIENVLHNMCMTQATLKSMDGASHQLYNSFKKNFSLMARYKKFVEGNHKNKKEANKILEYANTVERSLQAAEILQACAVKNEILRAERLRDCGLTECAAWSCAANNLKCVFYVMRPTPPTNDSETSPRKFYINELVVGVVDDCSVSNLLRALDEESETMELGSSGMVQEEVEVQPTLFKITSACLSYLGEFVLGSNASASDQVSIVSQNVTKAGHPLPSSIRIVGHSCGGGVAAILTSLLDGTLNVTSEAEASPFIGTYRDKVSCVSLGPPPSMSRAAVSRSVTSVICGDDVIPRASRAALTSLGDRVLRSASLKSGGGGLTWLNMDWLGDAASVAARGVQQYASGRHDLTSLQVPGRVFFVKSRKMQQGATIQRVLRGNWKEDLLWTLHEILVSGRMIEHHTLEAHIRTLSRC